MPRPCEAEGHYRAKIVDYGLFKADSGAVAINLKAHLLAKWEMTQGGEEPEWNDYSRSEIEAEGAVWIVLKNGKVNEPAVQSLCNHAGWDGDLDAIKANRWQPLLCQVTVKADTYKGETRYKIGFINSWSWRPGGGLSNISDEQLRELKEKYGDELRQYKPDRPAQHPAEAPYEPPPEHDFSKYPPEGEVIPFSWSWVAALILPFVGGMMS